MTGRKKPGPTPRPPDQKRSARISMRTYPHVAEAQTAIGTEETERAILKAARIVAKRAKEKR